MKITIVENFLHLVKLLLFAFALCAVIMLSLFTMVAISCTWTFADTFSLGFLSNRSILRRFTTLRNSETDFSETTSRRRSICVVGGGFGGLYAALSISGKLGDDTDLYLIDPKERFVFLPLLYELTIGTAAAVEVAPRYSDLLAGSRVKFIQGLVENIDFDRNTCLVKEHSNNERQLAFDQIVIAAGNQPKLDFIPGAKDHSIPFYRLEDSVVLKNRLESLKRTKRGFVRVVVIGAGYSGVELATSVADYFGKDNVIIKVVDRNSRIMNASADYNREVAQRSLIYNAVSVSHNTTVKSVEKNGVKLIDETGSEYFQEADLILFTAGSEQSPIIKTLPLKKDRTGRIITKPTLQSVDYDHVFALGDCGVIENYPLPCTAQVALQQSGTVATNVVRRYHYQRQQQQMMNNTSSAMNGPRLETFRYISLGEMLTLGKLDGAITSLGGYLTLNGPIAAIGRRAIYAVRMPTATQAIKAMVTASAVTTGKILSDIFKRDKA